MKKKFFIIVFFVFFSVILPNKSNAYSSDPKQFISEVVDKAKKILVETNSQEFKTKELSKIAMETVDIKGIGYYTLGNYRDNGYPPDKEYMNRAVTEKNKDQFQVEIGKILKNLLILNDPRVILHKGKGL